MDKNDLRSDEQRFWSPERKDHSAAAAKKKILFSWHKKLVVVLVGLPARGKSYIAHKIVSFLRWRGLKADLFNVGKARRTEITDEPQDAKFFAADNKEAKAKRENLAFAVLDDLLNWLEQGGDVAVFDATNTTRDRRIQVLQRCTARAQTLPVLFIESICDDERVLESNLRVKASNSPDYRHMKLEDALADLRKRIAEYEKVYEPINDDHLSYIKLINLQSKVICNKVLGRLGLLIAAFLMCIHVKLRPVYLVRAGHCEGVFEKAEPISEEGEDDATSPDGLRRSESGSNGGGGGISASKSSISLGQQGGGAGAGGTPAKKSSLSRVRSMEFGKLTEGGKIPTTMSMNASLSASGQKFSARLARFMMRKVVEWEASADGQSVLRSLHMLRSSSGDSNSTSNSPAVGARHTPDASPQASPKLVSVRLGHSAGGSGGSGGSGGGSGSGSSAPASPMITGLAGSTSGSGSAAAGSSGGSGGSSGSTMLALPSTMSRTQSLGFGGERKLSEHLLEPELLRRQSSSLLGAQAPLPLVVYTSTLPRSRETVDPLVSNGRVPVLSLESQSSLNMLDTGTCHGLSIGEIMKKMPGELEKWEKNKFRYRFPGGESHEDLALSMEPLVMEIERLQVPALCVSHQSTLQVLYGYFLGTSCPVDKYYALPIPQHTVIELVPNQYGWQERRYDLSSDEGEQEALQMDASEKEEAKTTAAQASAGGAASTGGSGGAGAGAAKDSTTGSSGAGKPAKKGGPMLHGTQFYDT